MSLFTLNSHRNLLWTGGRAPFYRGGNREVEKADLKVTAPPAFYKCFLGSSLGFLLLHWSNLSDWAFDGPKPPPTPLNGNTYTS